MSYLSSHQTLNLRKATISVWFRIPQATADAVEDFTHLPDFEVFDGIIPILVFGKQKHGTVTNWKWTQIGLTLGPDDPPFFLGGPPTSPVMETLPEGSHSGALAPTFIGVRVAATGAEGDKEGWLAVHLQTGDIGHVQNLAPTMTSYQMIFTSSGPGSFTVEVVETWANFSVQHFTYPDSLGNDGLPTDEGRAGGTEKEGRGFKVTFDEWHHLLLSWDIRGSNASHGRESGPRDDDMSTYIGATSTLYCAFDDVNKNGDELPGLRYSGMGPNETISYGTYELAGTSNVSGSPDRPSGPPSYSVGFSTGVIADGVFIPAQLEYEATYPPYSGAGPDNSGGDPKVRPIRRVEMAELQIFTGVTLDTEPQVNRRAFIGRDGTPVDPTGTEDDPAPAVKLLGKKPDVLLHGSSNWKTGKNTGTTGIRIEDGAIIEIPEGQFNPTGGIERYKPDPQISEDSTG